MSHSVTITRTTTSTTNTSYIVLNTGYLKSFPGILKLFELLICGAIVGLIAYYYTDTLRSHYRYDNGILFLFLMATTFLIATFCLLLACLTSLSTGGLIAKTIYELIYHSIAGILLLISSVNLLIGLSDRSRDREHNVYMAASILGLVNTVLYFISAWLAHRSYRGI